MSNIKLAWMDVSSEELERCKPLLASFPAFDANGHSWQYAGTMNKDDEWFHYFRHKAHPETGLRVSVQIEASREWCQKNVPAKPSQ